MKQPTPPDTVAAIVADYASGMSSIEVAAKHGSSSNTVLRYVKAAGIVRDNNQAKALAKQRREQEAARALEAESVLPAGDWVRYGLIWRYEIGEVA